MMKKEYHAPEAEIVLFTTPDTVMSDDLSDLEGNGTWPYALDDPIRIEGGLFPYEEE